jgi:hypothetical protein
MSKSDNHPNTPFSCSSSLRKKNINHPSSLIPKLITKRKITSTADHSRLKSSLMITPKANAKYAKKVIP